MINQRTKRLLITSAKWIFSGAMLAYVLHELDYAALADMLTKQKPMIVLGAASLIVLQIMVATFRWRRITSKLVGQGATPPYQHFLRLNFIGMFFNCCLPGTIGGDVVRGVMLRSEHRPISLCLHGVIIDRLVALTAVFLMVVLGLPWLAQIVPNVPAMGLSLLFVLLVMAGLVMVFYAPRFIHHPLIGKISRLLVSARAIIFSPFDLPLVMSQALLIQIMFCLAVSMLVTSLGSTLSIADSLLLVPLVVLLITLPISVGGWGVREFGMVGLLAFVGVPKHVALAVSVQLGVLQILVSLVGAWLYLKSKKLT